MAVPTDYVLTVYITEAAARAGLVDSSTSGEKALAVDGDGKINQAGQAAAYGFWTHTKYYYRIEANEPVKEFYIDWDDGEDNDPKAKANYTTIKLDTPAFVGITSHIYTGNSTIAGGYFPKIRCKSIEGFWSKFYQNRAATPVSTPISTGIDILQGETALTAGRNDKYRVESDNTTERIPALYPTIKPPIAILKSDRKRVYAGIDNGFLRGNDGDLDGETVTLIEVPNSGAAVRTGVNVEVTYTTTGLDGGTAGNRGDVIQTTLSLGGTLTLSNVTKILKVELLSLLEDSVAFNGTSPSTTKLFPGEKMVLVAGSYSDEKQQTLAEVSLGNPIVVLDEPRHTVTYDLTESFARTSEQSVSNYYLDDGKFKMDSGYAADAYIQQVGTTNTSQDTAANSDIFNDSTGILEISSGVAKRSYIFDVGYNYVDSDHRWLPKQILARGQIKTSNPSGMTTAKRDQQYSYLEHWVNESHTRNYSDIVNESVAAYNWPSDVTSSALLGFKGTQDLDRWVDLEDRNRLIGDDTNFIMKSGGDAARDLSGLYDFDHDNATSLDDVDNTAMLICARDSKWTKQFFKLCHDNAIDDSNTSPQGKADKVIPGSTADGAGLGTDGVGHMKTRVQALYTGYENDKSTSPMWKPLKLLNKTKHPDYDDSTWYADGSFEWEEPEDWASLDPETIPDKFWPRGDYNNDSNSWAYSDDLITSGTNINEVTAVTINTTTNDIAKLENAYIVFTRGATAEGLIKDVFWFDINGLTSEPDTEDLKTRHGDISELSTINKIEVDIQGLGNTDVAFAAKLQDIIDGNANYSATVASNVVTVTHATFGVVFDAHQHGSTGTPLAITFSVTTQGVDVTYGDNWFDTVGGDKWNATNKKYAIMFLIETDSGAAGTSDSYKHMNVQYTWPCSNAHSVLVDLIDPMCVSLNSRTIVQSIAYVHKGKYQIIEDRLGKADIRKIGASGGSMKFGGIDLVGETDRLKFYEYQTQATPIYIDVEHRNGDRSRFFGIITEMSEDHPTGKVIPKFGLTMQISHMITMDSSGAILSNGYISLGGDISEPRYV
jgi:hypothetical protein